MRDQLLGDRYRLVRQLGEGGMGQVWEAQDETLSRNVAVKVISLLAGAGSRGDEARARFLREARITAQLQHPNIVTIHDLGETGGGNERVPFLVMELVRGEGLDTMLRRGVVTLADAARWGAQICDALAEAHDAGIMHRDIKPSNILITPSGTVKVLDFGIARAADPYATADRLTQTGFIVGTPPYMAPEQARGFPEPRSDLYALGCLLFELITGRLPFQAPDTVGYLTAHLTQEPPTPSSISTGVPSAWDDLVLRLLNKDPDRRYPNATELSHALRHLDRTPEPAKGLAPPSGGATQPPSMTATTPLPPVAPTRRASSLSPRPNTASTHTPARRGRATRFVLPVCLWLLSLASLAGPRQIGIPVALAVAWAFTAVLTPRSTGLTRGTGYVAVAALAVQLVGFVTHFWDDISLGISLWWPILGMIVPTIPAYCYRDIKTRRARSARGTSDSGGTATAAITLAFLCLPGLLSTTIATLQYLTDPSAPTGPIAVNLAVGIVETVLLTTGALLLLQHRTAGRWMIVATGGAAALHGLSFSVQYLVMGGPKSAAMFAFLVGPLMAVSATAAVITAVLPSTGEWCLRRSQTSASAT